MRIYNPFSKEYYDSNFCISKVTEGCTQSTHYCANESVYFNLKKVIFVVKDEKIRKRFVACH